jgi:hypothetical protein
MSYSGVTYYLITVKRIIRNDLSEVVWQQGRKRGSEYRADLALLLSEHLRVSMYIIYIKMLSIIHAEQR